MLIMFNPARGVIAASRGITPKVLWTRAVEIAKTFDPGRMMDIRAMSPSGLFGLQIPIVMMS
ncbi:hypothetical protein HZC34_02800 [Candidatus Saganbacteria bacterium]|nr:hypothetical protein [Candidatus Saganbacteria bacterium]